MRGRPGTASRRCSVRSILLVYTSPVPLTVASSVAVWFGINDIEITWKRGEEFPPLLESTFDQLSTGMERLYALGGAFLLPDQTSMQPVVLELTSPVLAARHFLVPLLPPYHRSPLLLRVFSAVPGANDTFYDNFVAWNDRMKRFVGDFAESKPEASVAMWDTWTEFDKVRRTPRCLCWQSADLECRADPRRARRLWLCELHQVLWFSVCGHACLRSHELSSACSWCDSYSKYLWAVDLPEMSDIQNCGYSVRLRALSRFRTETDSPRRWMNTSGSTRVTRRRACTRSLPRRLPRCVSFRSPLFGVR